MEFPVLKLSTKERTRLISTLRRLWRNGEATREKRKTLQVDSKTAMCEKCNSNIHKKLLELDHIEPIGGILLGCKGDLNLYFERLMFGELQGLCPDCHGEKTKATKLRKEPKAPKPKKSKAVKKPVEEDISFLN